MLWKLFTRIIFLFELTLFHVHGSLYDPHLFPETGPFFEGWYMRITDFDKPQSLGLLFGRVLPANDTKKQDPLVIASILLRNCSGEMHDGNNKCRLVSIDGKFRFSQLNVTVSGQKVTKNPDLISPPDFQWEVSSSDNGGSFTQVGDKTTFEFRLGDIMLRGIASDPTPWNSRGSGPEDWLVNLPLPLHWFVFSLRSKLNYYEVQNTTTGAVTRSRNGVVHLEKNWGNSFPPRWIWSEGVSRNKNSNASFALSGGTVNFTVTSVDAFLIGYRNPSAQISLDFRPDNSVVSKQVDGCSGVVNITVYSLGFKVVINFKSAPETYSKCLLGPETQGFRRACVESYDATVEFRVYRRNFIPWSFTEIDHMVFTGAGLEFGGTYVCHNKCQ